MLTAERAPETDTTRQPTPLEIQLIEECREHAALYQNSRYPDKGVHIHPINPNFPAICIAFQEKGKRFAFGDDSYNGPKFVIYRTTRRKKDGMLVIKPKEMSMIEAIRFLYLVETHFNENHPQAERVKRLMAVAEEKVSSMMLT